MGEDQRERLRPAAALVNVVDGNIVDAGAMMGKTVDLALDGTPVSEQWVVQMALGVTFAGHDSTTGHLSWALIDLLQHPEELRKVLAEQLRILPDGAPLDLSAVHRMACLHRALRETARLRPVGVPIRQRRLSSSYEVSAASRCCCNNNIEI